MDCKIPLPLVRGSVFYYMEVNVSYKPVVQEGKLTYRPDPKLSDKDPM